MVSNCNQELLIHSTAQTAEYRRENFAVYRKMSYFTSLYASLYSHQYPIIELTNRRCSHDGAFRYRPITCKKFVRNFKASEILRV